MWDGPASPFLTSVWLSREIKIYMHLFFEWHGTSGPFRILNFRLGGLFDALWAQTYAKNSEKSWLDWLEVYRLLIWPPFWPRCRGCCSQPVWSLWPLVTLVAQVVAQGWLFLSPFWRGRLTLKPFWCGAFTSWAPRFVVFRSDPDLFLDLGLRRCRFRRNLGLKDSN